MWRTGVMDQSQSTVPASPALPPAAEVIQDSGPMETKMLGVGTHTFPQRQRNIQPQISS